MTQLPIGQKKYVFSSDCIADPTGGIEFDSLRELIKEIKKKKSEAFFLLGYRHDRPVTQIAIPSCEKGEKAIVLGTIEEVTIVSDMWRKRF